MLDSLYSGISGLDSFQKTLNTESNNISNVNTIAYKSDVVSFADLMYQDGIGKGTSIINVKKDFTQGDFKLTGNAYDMAIDGDGFFSVQDPKTSDFYYTRAGNFGMGVDGFLQTPSGEQVMGLTIEAPEVVSTNASVTQFGNAHSSFLGTQNISTDTVLQNINAKATNYIETAVASGISGDGYKSASSKVRDVEALATAYRSALSSYGIDPVEGTSSTVQTSTLTFPAANVSNYGDSVSLYVDGVKFMEYFDTDATTTLNNLSDKISNIDGVTSSADATGLITITSLVPGKDILLSGALLISNDIESQPTINTTDAIAGSGLSALTSVRDALKTAVENAGAEFLELTDTVDLDNQNSLTLTNLNLQLDDLKVSDNAFGDFSVVDDALYMTQGDNRFLVGKIVTTVFADKKGLDPKGNNLYEQTKDSGEPLYVYGAAKVSNEIIELSNADFSEGLVNMMTFQRSFEASSKTINTSDEILKTTLNLKK